MNVVLKICATFLVVLMVLARMHHALPKTASQIQEEDLKTLECKKDLDCPVGRPCCTAIKVDFKTHHVCAMLNGRLWGMLIIRIANPEWENEMEEP